MRHMRHHCPKFRLQYRPTLSPWGHLRHRRTFPPSSGKSRRFCRFAICCWTITAHIRWTFLQFWLCFQVTSSRRAWFVGLEWVRGSSSGSHYRLPMHRSIDSGIPPRKVRRSASRFRHHASRLLSLYRSLRPKCCSIASAPKEAKPSPQVSKCQLYIQSQPQCKYYPLLSFSALYPTKSAYLSSIAYLLWVCSQKQPTQAQLCLFRRSTFRLTNRFGGPIWGFTYKRRLSSCSRLGKMRQLGAQNVWTLKSNRGLSAQERLWWRHRICPTLRLSPKRTCFGILIRTDWFSAPIVSPPAYSVPQTWYRRRKERSFCSLNADTSSNRLHLPNGCLRFLLQRGTMQTIWR